MDNTHDIFTALAGAWRLRRHITPGGEMLGTVEFIRHPDGGLKYKEEGSLTLDNGDIIHDVTRSYLYKLINHAIQVYYADGPDDGALFHTLDFTSDNEAHADHLCGEDMYRSHYQFNLPDKFTVRHEVKGPKKDYVSKTLFTRLDHL